MPSSLGVAHHPPRTVRPECARDCRAVKRGPPPGGQNWTAGTGRTPNGGEASGGLALAAAGRRDAHGGALRSGHSKARVARSPVSLSGLYQPVQELSAGGLGCPRGWDRTAGFQFHPGTLTLPSAAGSGGARHHLLHFLGGPAHRLLPRLGPGDPRNAGTLWAPQAFPLPSCAGQPFPGE